MLESWNDGEEVYRIEQAAHRALSDKARSLSAQYPGPPATGNKRLAYLAIIARIMSAAFWA